LAKSSDRLTAKLRDWIIGGVYVGSLRGGDRLSSIREVARETGEDPRAVARAYRNLEVEGLVEVKGRSGVFVAPQLRDGGIQEEGAEWMAGVLLEGWKRRIPVVELPRFLRAHSVGASLRCAFVEAWEDVFEMFAPELRDEFGLDVRRVWLDTLPVPGSPGAGDPARLPVELRNADLIVSTIFNAATVRALTAGLAAPLVVLSQHPRAVEQVTDYLRRSPSPTLVCVCPRFGDRIRLHYQHMGVPDRLRVVLADDDDAVASLDRRQPVLISRAAQKRLGSSGLQPVAPHYPSLSPESAEQIIGLLVRANARTEVARGRTGIGARDSALSDSRASQRA
jgi:DNA-binding transcriptional regulator YhcF (GntR family)